MAPANITGTIVTGTASGGGSMSVNDSKNFTIPTNHKFVTVTLAHFSYPGTIISFVGFPSPQNYLGIPIAFYDGSAFLQPIIPGVAEIPYKFSKNFIPVKFTTNNHITQSGRASVNAITFSSAVGDTEISLSWNSARSYAPMKAVVAVANPGSEFPRGNGNAAYIQSILPYFKANYLLSRDFIITATNNSIVFTSKTQGYGFDMLRLGGIPDGNPVWSVDNLVTGRPEILKDNFGYEFELYCQTADGSKFESIYTTRIPLIKGAAEVDIASHLHDYLERDVLDIPGLPGTPLVCTKSCRKYYYTYGESWGSPVVVKGLTISPEYIVLSGGLSFLSAAVVPAPAFLAPSENDPASDKFLRQGKTTTSTRSNQPQYLYFFNTRTSRPAAKLKAKLFFNDSTDTVVTLETLNLEAYKKYGFNVRFDKIINPANYPGKTVIKYQVWLETSAGAKVSEYIGFVVDYTIRNWTRCFLHWSSWGALDSKMCFGKGNSEYELSYSEAFHIHKSGYNVQDGLSTIFDLRLKNEFKVATGYMLQDELILNRDFFLSEHKFRFYKDQLLPIKVTSKNIPETEDGNNLFAQSFEYAYLWDENAFTEGDVDGSGLQAGLNIPTFTTSMGTVLIVDQNGNIITEVPAPGQYQVTAFTAIRVTRNMNSGISIVAAL
jgi:hypothetical protein